VVIALVVTPEGLPLAYEIMAGNTADSTTLRGFLHRIERQYGKARRVWVMDRGIPTLWPLRRHCRRPPPPVIRAFRSAPPTSYSPGAGAFRTPRRGRVGRAAEPQGMGYFGNRSES